MRISDWSSYVCSADLPAGQHPVEHLHHVDRADQHQEIEEQAEHAGHQEAPAGGAEGLAQGRWGEGLGTCGHASKILNVPGLARDRLPALCDGVRRDTAAFPRSRSEERRVGKECVSTFRSWWAPGP